MKILELLYNYKLSKAVNLAGKVCDSQSETGTCSMLLNYVQLGVDLFSNIAHYCLDQKENLTL